jgi:uncharacterized coiled-coil protein SlyX
MKLRLCLFLFVLFISSICAGAQELVSTPEPNVTERVRQLESELERQNTKLDQLQKTLMEQQATIQALLDKLSTQPTLPATNAKATETAATTTARSDAAPAEPQTPTVEQRLAKVEGQVLKIGPVRFSGDFRLRFDGIYRSATHAPDPPLDHVQNARGRYRLRLNFDTDLYPSLQPGHSTTRFQLIRISLRSQSVRQCRSVKRGLSIARQRRFSYRAVACRMSLRTTRDFYLTTTFASMASMKDTQRRSSQTQLISRVSNSARDSTFFQLQTSR